MKYYIRIPGAIVPQLFPSPDADPFKDRLLSQDDVPDVVCGILDVQTKSDLLGRVLKLPAATVESIHLQYSDPQKCLFHVIDEFVKQVEPPPTWRVILEALRNPLIGQHRLAQEIERKHCPLSLKNEGIFLLLPQMLLSLYNLCVLVLPEPHPVQQSKPHAFTTTRAVEPVESSLRQGK